MINRKASAQWNGSLKEGSGTISTESGILDETPYSFTSRFEQGPQTNPEELVGAAHAACFSMALSNELQQENCTPLSVSTQAEVTLGKVDGGWDVTRIHLQVRARVSNIDPESFQSLANRAKENCPISKLFRAEISMDAELEEAENFASSRGAERQTDHNAPL